MSVINTNINSLVSQNAVVKNNRDLTQAMQQLSTGKRINSAKDDAAGLAISNRMTSQIRGLDQAVRNGNDAMSLLQTTEGAMIEMTNMLQRMRELAVQSSNDTYTTVDRAYMDVEFQQLKTEINRITDTTDLNGMAFLNGTTGTKSGSLGILEFQVGAYNGQTISHTVSDMGFRYDAKTAFETTTANATGIAQVSKLTLSGSYVAGDKITFGVGDVIKNYTVVAADVAGDETANLTAITAKLKTAAETDLAVFATPTPASASAAQVSTLTLSGSYKVGEKFAFTVDGEKITYTVLPEDVVSGVDATIQSAIATKLLNASATPVGSAAVAVTKNANVLTFTANSVNSVFTASTPETDVGVTASTNVLTFTATTKGTGFTTKSSAELVDTGALKNLQPLTILDNDDANATLVQMDVAINRMNAERAGLGAVINRLNYAVDNLANVSLTTSESRSRILDADYAKASGELARTQIISQAATAMLAQANQLPQTVLKLLQG